MNTPRHDTAVPQAASVPARPRGEPTQSRRVVSVDNLKAVLVAWIIFCHGLLGYMAIGGWPYDEVNESQVQPRVELAVSLLLGPSAFFIIGTFFFVAGLFAAHELEHGGRVRYATIRLVRLGVPWVTFVLLVWPLCMWCAYRAAGDPLSFADAFRQRQPFLDSGPLWFVQILLYVSVVYALVGQRGLVPATAGRHVGRLLVIVTALVAALSFGVRIWFPARSQQVLDLHVWQWPQCFGMFALGVIVSSRGWASRVPARVVRACVAVALAVLVLMVGTAGWLGITSFADEGDHYLGGWRWEAGLLAVLEAMLVVSASVVVLAMSQRWLTSSGRLVTACARAAYGAFILQAPALIGLAILVRPLPWPATAKALVVGLLAVLASFFVAWVLVTRTVVRRLL